MATETKPGKAPETAARPKSEVLPARSERGAVPARPMSPFDEMERLMEQMFGEPFGGWLRPMSWSMPMMREFRTLSSGMPRIDVIERDDAVVVRAELPGVDRKNVDVSITQNSVTIKGETSREEKEQEKGYYFRSEISRGAFARTVGLPGDVDTENAKAVFKDGVLELTMPKVRKAVRRSIKLD